MLQVGIAKDPQKTDPVFEDGQMQDAENLALRKSSAENEIYAIWNEVGDIVYIAFQWQLYKPA